MTASLAPLSTRATRKRLKPGEHVLVRPHNFRWATARDLWLAAQPPPPNPTPPARVAANVSPRSTFGFTASVSSRTSSFAVLSSRSGYRPPIIGHWSASPFPNIRLLSEAKSRSIGKPLTRTGTASWIGRCSCRNQNTGGRAHPAGDITQSSVGYAHDAVPAFETSSGVAAPVPAAGRRSGSGRRVLDAVPARPHTGRAPKPPNPVESAPRSCQAATPHPRRRRLIEKQQGGHGVETG